MKTLIMCAILGIATARPQNPQDAYITRYDNDNAGLGGYSFGVETSDGFRHDQTGEIVNPGAEDESLVVRGSYSYVGPDGVVYTVEYIADENGYQPAGAHIPQSAGVRKLGIPAAAQASLIGGGLG
ncbi:flexible cuticle protein 12 [Tribolium castaneum]|uniref:Larval cuticle protein 5-like Protein n=2 Tax=Tribolium castaneum TaxID=7070 RepID=D6WMA8_TRICA|nr:PREDICTED: flexible cuticle protein 12 [Tribolium castaneum]EFA03332.2 Larval cuticle protein 5-like Protein [Tribolium castaneum]|eukprot:XP_008193936.1 PREDICTED: flexible cuticle protein 12 [Tribolium castaneum]